MTQCSTAIGPMLPDKQVTQFLRRGIIFRIIIGQQTIGY
jgi:hypothetical protein